MFGRFGVWVAIIAILQQIMLPGAASAHQHPDRSERMPVCTSTGIVLVASPFAASPGGNEKESHEIQCSGCCVCGDLVALAADQPSLLASPAILGDRPQPRSLAAPAGFHRPLAAQPRGPPALS
jgi:hypothetical protein